MNNSYFDQFLEIAESGNMEIINNAINRFEQQNKLYGLNREGEEILTLLKNSLNWIRPADLYSEVKIFNPFK